MGRNSKGEYHGMTAYIIKYCYKGFLAAILYFIYPDGKIVIVADTANEAIEKFKRENKNKVIYDIKRVR